MGAAAAGGPLRAQQPGPRPGPEPQQATDLAATDLAATEARLVERLDTILARAEAIPPRGRRERTGLVPTEMDTLMIAGLRVITPVDDVEKVTPWARRTVEAFEARLGPIPEVATPPTIRVDWYPSTTYAFTDSRSLTVHRWTPGTTRQAFGGIISQALVHELPAPVGHWLAGPLGPEGAAYRELSAHPAPEVQACHAGEVDACAAALGLTPVDDAEPILTPQARRSFLHYLLRTRPGALGRLLALDADAVGGAGSRPGAPGSAPRLRALLERAAGSSLDPVIAEWRDAVLDGPPAVMPASVVGTSLLWILLLLALATRSTRWRTG
jgi:hypothetical protein